ncbi:MAG: hypothetical protein JWP03_2679 [Phycisphaerales bacterium]|jgi:hypothetical protein|nr:hypothetical protein [Phycisphaerales bacterium]
MRRLTGTLFATAFAVAFMLLALWMWQGAAGVPIDGQASRSESMAWALRSLAVACAALAQLVTLRLVVGRIYRRGALDDALCLSSVVACAIALVSAAALGLAGR